MTSPSGETAAGVQHDVLLLVSHDGHEQGPHLPGVCLLCLFCVRYHPGKCDTGSVHG